MDDIPLSTLGLALAVLLVTSGFFSIAETAMMAVNRYRLKHRAHRGERGAKLALALLGKTDTLLGVILLGNNLINAGAATLTAVITERLLRRRRVRAGAGHAWSITFADPRVLRDHAEGRRRGARRPHRAGRELHAGADAEGGHARSSGSSTCSSRDSCKLLRIKRASEAGSTLTQEELRSLVLEGQYFRGKHRAHARQPARPRDGDRRRRDDAAQPDPRARPRRQGRR